MTKRAYLVEVPKGTCIDLRDPTKKELTDALKVEKHRIKLLKIIQNAEQEIESMDKNCKHTVWYDEEGYPYDVRTCVACHTMRGI